MKKLEFAGILVIIVLVGGCLWVFLGSWIPASETGFSLVRLNDNSLLVSDADVLSFNASSQEMVLSDASSRRLLQAGDSLYMFNGTVSVRVNGEEIYQAIFRASSMSALPAPPTIAICFPSMHFPSGVEDDHELRLFYPGFQPPGDLADMNAKLTQYFQETGRLVNYPTIL